ncbi:MAG: lipid-binding SYLF domain-containing protein [Blastocatellia bacterium]|nr:lipid-binding SYLF domain-containing protein [Blastocatellia bacterium]
MKQLALPAMAFIFLSITSVSALADKKDDANERANKAAVVLREIMSAPDQSIPQDLLDRAYCVAVFPTVLKGGFIFGGQYGRGVASCRRDKGSWGAPAFFTIGGGSFGLQIGGQAVDLVLLFINDDGVSGLLRDKFEIGAGAGAAAGPVGRNTTATTDIQFNAKIISYSRSKGLFAGLELKGAVINPDKNTNNDVYGQKVTAREILVDAKVRAPETFMTFPQTLGQFSAQLAENTKQQQQQPKKTP